MSGVPSGVSGTAIVGLPTGDLLLGTEPAGLLRSSDSGETWTELNGFSALCDTETWSEYGNRAAHVESVAFDPHDASRLYAGVEIGGAYRSDDGGESWVGVNDGIYDDIHDLVVDPRTEVECSRRPAAVSSCPWIAGVDWRPADGDVGSRYCTRLLAVVGAVLPARPRRCSCWGPPRDRPRRGVVQARRAMALSGPAETRVRPGPCWKPKASRAAARLRR